MYYACIVMIKGITIICKKRGRGLASVGDNTDAAIRRLEDYIKKSKKKKKKRKKVTATTTV